MWATTPDGERGPVGRFHLAYWYRSAWLSGSFALVLMAACVGSVLFARELPPPGGGRQQAEHDLRTILNNLPSMIGYWDRDLHNRANHAYVEWFGKAPDEMRGKISASCWVKSLPESYHLGHALQGHAQS